MTERIRRIYARVDCLTPPFRRHLQWSARSSMKDHHHCHSGLLTHISTESTLHISSEVNPIAYSAHSRCSRNSIDLSRLVGQSLIEKVMLTALGQAMHTSSISGSVQVVERSL